MKIRGAELEVLTSITPNLDLIGSYSYIDARIESGDEADKRGAERAAAAGIAVGQVPPHLARSARCHRRQRRARYIGKSWNGMEVLRTGLNVIRRHSALRPRSWRVRVNASDIADTRNTATCLSFGDCFYGMGRTVLSTVTYRSGGVMSVGELAAA